jgi:hypothetical protein
MHQRNEASSQPSASRLSPAPFELTRRQASALILAGAAGLLVRPSIARAQPATSPYTPPGATPPQPVASFLDKLITVKTSKTKDRTLRVTIHIQGYAEDTNKRAPNNNNPVDIRTLDFDTAAIVFPVIYGCATSLTDTETVKGAAKYQERLIDSTPEYTDTYACGTRLGKWTMLKQRGGREMDLDIEIPMTCNAITFDEKGAAAAVWPSKWGKVGQSCFLPRQASIDWQDKSVTDLVMSWTDGKDPKKLAPVALAKYLASKCIEFFQPSGNGESYLPNGGLEGLVVQNASHTISTRQGSEHDIACAVCAIFRAAGLPARTVIGYDLSEKRGEDRSALGRKSGRGELRSWIEFCLYDEQADKELWVPIDVIRQRKKSNRAPALDRPWPYFGNYDDGDLVMPFAFQFHPPTTVVQYGSMAFWGWLVTPAIPAASQFVRFNAITTPKSSNKPRTPAR